MTVARYLDPVPYVVADDGVDGVVVVLGADYRGVLFLAQEPMSVVRDRVQARGIPPVLARPWIGSRSGGDRCGRRGFGTGRGPGGCGRAGR